MYIIAKQNETEIAQLKSMGFDVELLLNDKIYSLFGKPNADDIAEEAEDAANGEVWVGFWADCDPADVFKFNEAV